MAISSVGNGTSFEMAQLSNSDPDLHRDDVRVWERMYGHYGISVVDFDWAEFPFRGPGVAGANYSISLQSKK